MLVRTGEDADLQAIEDCSTIKFVRSPHTSQRELADCDANVDAWMSLVKAKRVNYPLGHRPHSRSAAITAILCNGLQWLEGRVQFSEILGNADGNARAAGWGREFPSWMSPVRARSPALVFLTCRRNRCRQFADESPDSERGAVPVSSGIGSTVLGGHSRGSDIQRSVPHGCIRIVARRLTIVVGLLTCCTLAHGAQFAQTNAAELPTREALEHFELNVRPLLATTCAKCHGSQRASGGLRVDSRAALLNGGDHGLALIPGRGLLIQAVRRTHDEVAVPPDEELSADAIGHITRFLTCPAFLPFLTSCIDW